MPKSPVCVNTDETQNRTQNFHSLFYHMRLAMKLPEIIADLAGLAGAGLLSWGTYSIYEPAGFIAGGVMLLAGAVLFSRAAA
jgi:hypothetical protein